MKSVEYSGRTHTGCRLLVDEELKQLEVEAPKRLSRKSVSLAKLFYGPSATISTEGSTVRFGQLTMIADSPADAAEIARLVRKPAEVKKQLEEDLAEVESSVLGFLELREEMVSFSARLRSEPREAYLSLSAVWTDETQDPVDQFFSRGSRQLEDRFEQMKSSVGRVEQRIGARATERLYAFVYSVGSIQNSFLSAEGSRTAEMGFMEELGLDASQMKGMGLTGSAKSLLDANRAALFPLQA